MKYLLTDNFENTQKIVDEKDLRDIYYKNMEEIIYNWQNCGDKKLVEELKKEKENVYNVNIKEVINRIEEDNWFYEIKEV